MFSWKKSDRKEKREKSKDKKASAANAEDGSFSEVFAAFERHSSEATSASKGVFNLPLRRSSRKRRESQESQSKSSHEVPSRSTDAKQPGRHQPVDAQQHVDADGLSRAEKCEDEIITSKQPTLTHQRSVVGPLQSHPALAEKVPLVLPSRQDPNRLQNGSQSTQLETTTIAAASLTGEDRRRSVTSGREKGRVIQIKRNDKGEFGITLRQFRIPGKVNSSEGTSADRVIIVVEPTLESSYLKRELRSGDALVAVNGSSVVEVKKEDIAKRIAACGPTAFLTLLNMPELSRAIPPTVNVVSRNPEDGRVAKTEEQVASEKEWLDKERVWYVHDDGFTAAKVLEKREQEGKDNDSSVTTHYKLKLEQSNTGDVNAEEDLVERANPPQYDRAEDLIVLRHLNESSCLHTLQQRYAGSLIHTFAGQDLIVINPKQRLAIYSEKVMQMFGSCKQEDMPPHVYAVAQATYRNMLTLRNDQSIVYLGPSGSGKTTNFKHTVRYYANALVSSHGNATADKLAAGLSLVGSFGNARTALCSSASRFSLLSTLQFDASGQLVGAVLQIYLAEKSRVVHQPIAESSFKIFHQLLACQDDQLRCELMLEDGVQDDNCFFNASEMARDAGYYDKEWKETLSSLETLGVSRDEAMGLWAPLASIIHLGEAGIVINEQTGKPQFAHPASAHRAAAVLGTTDEELSRIIFSSANMRIRASKQSNASSEDSTSLRFDGGGVSIYSEASFIPFDMCMAALRGFAMGLYMESFSALVRLINRAVATTVKTPTSIHLLDSPGFQNPRIVGAKKEGASFEDLCVNYACEKMHWFKHFTTVAVQQDRYARENIEVGLAENSLSNEDALHTLDKLKLDRSLSKSSHPDAKGLFWMLEDEAAKSNNTEVVFVDKLKSQHHVDRVDSVIQSSEQAESFTIAHLFKSTPVKYNARGWFKMVKEHPVIKMAYTLLTESKKKYVSDLYIGHRSGVLQVEVSRHRTTKRSTHSSAAAAVSPVKKNSVFMHLKVQLETIIDTLRRTNPKFIHCFCADSLTMSSTASLGSRGSGAGAPCLDLRLVRRQFRGMQLLESMRTYRQGYPEHMPFGEFRRRFAILVPKGERQDDATVLDEKEAVLRLSKQMELDKRSFKVGLSQIFFRAGCLAQFEDARDDTLNETIVAFQARCRGVIGRKHVQRLKIQHLAVTCLQRNIRKFFAVRDWPWWKLYTRVLPLLDVHRTEQQLQTKTNEVDVLQSKISELEKQNMDAVFVSRRLQKKVDELMVTSSQANASVVSTNELLEQEVVDRLQLEDELRELKERHDALQDECDKLKSEPPLTRVSSVLEDTSDSEGDDSVYRSKYRSLARDFENMKQRMSLQAEEEAEDYAKQRKHVERQLADERAESEDLRRQLNNTRRKLGKLQAEMEDMKLIVESTQSRNADLEKRQRKFDSDVGKVRDELANERTKHDTAQKEKDALLAEKFTLENDAQSVREELERTRRKIGMLETEAEDVSRIGKTDSSEVLTLRRDVRELRVKCEEQEEELDDQAGQIQQLQQSRLKLEMSSQKDKHQFQRDLEAKDEEMEKIRADATRKGRSLEEQLEEETRGRSDAVKVRRDLERKIFELQSAVDDVDVVGDRRLRKELRRVHALYKDTKHALEQKEVRDVDKSLVKQLRNQLEDAEFTKHLAIKSKKQLESDVKDLNAQLSQMSLAKQEVEDRCFSLAKQLADLQDKIEDDEDDVRETIRKNKQLLAQIAELQGIRLQLKGSLEDIRTEKDELEAKVTTLTNRLLSSETNTIDRLSYEKLEVKARDLEERLDVEMALKMRFENQINRLKDNSARVQDERDSIHSKEGRMAIELSKLARQVKDQREEIESLYHQEAEHKRRKEKADSELTVAEDTIMATKTELHLANKRIRDLQESLETEMLSSDDDDVISLYSEDGDGARRSLRSMTRRTSNAATSQRHRDTYDARAINRRASFDSPRGGSSVSPSRRVSAHIAAR